MQSRFEPYLEEMEHRLSGVPRAERREWREEAAQHLSSLAAAHEELGATPEEAAEAAVAQFGDVGRIGAMVGEAERRRLSCGKTFAEQTVSAMAILYRVPFLAYLLTAMGFVVVYLWLDSESARGTYPGLTQAAFLLAPLLGGVDGALRLRQWARQPEAAPSLRVRAFAVAWGVVVLPFFGAALLLLSSAGAADPLWGMLWLPAATVVATWTYRLTGRTPRLPSAVSA
jgi:hypothetical protein